MPVRLLQRLLLKLIRSCIKWIFLQNMEIFVTKIEIFAKMQIIVKNEFFVRKKAIASRLDRLYLSPLIFL